MIYIDKNIRKSVVHQHYLLSSIITFSFSKTENGEKKLFIFQVSNAAANSSHCHPLPY